MRHPPAMLDFRQFFFFLDLFGIISVAIYSPLVNIKTNCTVKSLYRLADIPTSPIVLVCSRCIVDPPHELQSGKYPSFLATLHQGTPNYGHIH